MRRIFLTLALVFVIGVASLVIAQQSGIDILGLGAGSANASSTHESIGSSSSFLRDGISAVPLAVDVSAQSTDSGSLIAVSTIAVIVLLLGSLTAAMIFWDGRRSEAA